MADRPILDINKLQEFVRVMTAEGKPLPDLKENVDILPRQPDLLKITRTVVRG